MHVIVWEYVTLSAFKYNRMFNLSKYSRYFSCESRYALKIGQGVKESNQWYWVYDICMYIQIIYLYFSVHVCNWHLEYIGTHRYNINTTEIFVLWLSVKNRSTMGTQRKCGNDTKRQTPSHNISRKRESDIVESGGVPSSKILLCWWLHGGILLDLMKFQVKVFGKS